MERISKLEPVVEAYERAAGEALQIPGLPTIQARLLLSGVNRLVGPTARGINRAGSISPTSARNAARTAVLAQLLNQPAPGGR
jgi:hypothetical protein